jgi:roadblock/LC7 domain-containing protein
MILHKQFMITYFSTKDGQMITRKGTWTEKCKYFTSKVGNHMMTYFDMDAQGYRTAKQSWTVRYL